MVDQTRQQQKIVEAVATIYTRLDEQIAEYIASQNQCQMCGKCCDFDAFGHRLFVSSPELLFFKNRHRGLFLAMTSGRCPYQVDKRCTVYSYRFAGCRIFNCNADADWQNALSEETLIQFKEICERFDYPYRYGDLKSVLI